MSTQCTGAAGKQSWGGQYRAGSSGQGHRARQKEAVHSAVLLEQARSDLLGDGRPHNLALPTHLGQEAVLRQRGAFRLSRSRAREHGREEAVEQATRLLRGGGGGRRGGGGGGGCGGGCGGGSGQLFGILERAEAVDKLGVDLGLIRQLHIALLREARAGVKIELQRVHLFAQDVSGSRKGGRGGLRPTILNTPLALPAASLLKRLHLGQLKAQCLRPLHRSARRCGTMAGGAGMDGDERVPSNAQTFVVAVSTRRTLVQLEVMQPRLALLHATGTQVPNRLIHDDIEAAVIDSVGKNAGVGQSQSAPTIDGVLQS